MTLRRALVSMLIAAVVLSFGLLAYGIRVRASANALINSAVGIRSTADAEREIAIWRSRSGCEFLESTDSPNGDHTYDFRIENGLLHRLRIIPPTFLGMTIDIRNAELRYVTVVMFSGSGPSAEAGVWVSGWFDLWPANKFRVDSKEKPLKAILHFSSTVPEPSRRKAFALNANCFVRLGQCKSAEDILPAVWQFP